MVFVLLEPPPGCSDHPDRGLSHPRARAGEQVRTLRDLSLRTGPAEASLKWPCVEGTRFPCPPQDFSCQGCCSWGATLLIWRLRINSCSGVDISGSGAMNGLSVPHTELFFFCAFVFSSLLCTHLEGRAWVQEEYILYPCKEADGVWAIPAQELDGPVQGALETLWALKHFFPLPNICED